MFNFFSKSDITLGLDIGSNLVKLIQLHHTAKGLELMNIGIDTVPPETIVDGTVMDIDPVIKIIQKLLKQLDIKTKDVNTAVAGKAVIVKKVKLPYTTEKEINEAINWEAEQFIPFNMDEVILDFKVLSINPDEKNMEVLLVAVKKEKINNHLDLIRTAGLNPKIIDTDAFAIENAYEFSTQPEPDKIIALINIGCSITNVNVICNGIPYFTRDITIGGNNFTKALQKDLLLNFEEAEHLKISYNKNVLDKKPKAEDSTIDEDVQKTIENVMDELSIEISHSFEYFQSSSEGKKISKVVLSGGTAKIQNIDKFLSTKLNLAVEINDPLKNIIIDENKFDLKYIKSIAPMLTVGIGLALRQGE